MLSVQEQQSIYKIARNKIYEAITRKYGHWVIYTQSFRSHIRELNSAPVNQPSERELEGNLMGYLFRESQRLADYFLPLISSDADREKRHVKVQSYGNVRTGMNYDIVIDPSLRPMSKTNGSTYFATTIGCNPDLDTISQIDVL